MLHILYSLLPVYTVPNYNLSPLVPIVSMNFQTILATTQLPFGFPYQADMGQVTT